MGQLPQVVELHEQFKDRDDFALITVSYDRSHTIDRMHEVIKEYGITYPVLHQFVNEKPWAFGYEIRYIPKTVLIDPMGNIWGDFRINDDLPEVLEFLMAQDEGYLPVILNAKGQQDKDATSLEIEVYSSTHVKADLLVNGYLTILEYDEFGYYRTEFSLPGSDELGPYKYTLNLVMPGSKHLNSGKGLVISKKGILSFEEGE